MEISRTEAGHYQCPTCGTSETLRGRPFLSKKGVNIHHVQAHDESISKSTTECRRCGDTFEYYTDSDQRLYCDGDCSRAAMCDGTHPVTQAHSGR